MGSTSKVVENACRWPEIPSTGFLNGKILEVHFPSMHHANSELGYAVMRTWTEEQEVVCFFLKKLHCPRVQ